MCFVVRQSTAPVNAGANNANGGSSTTTMPEDKGTIGLIVIVSLIIVSLIIAPVSTGDNKWAAQSSEVTRTALLIPGHHK